MQLARGVIASSTANADFERREVPADQQHAAPCRERAFEVLAAVDADALEQPLDRREPTDAHLDERHADGVEVPVQQLALLRGGEIGEADLDVAPCDALLALLQEPQQASEPTSDRAVATRAAASRRRA